MFAQRSVRLVIRGLALACASAFVAGRAADQSIYVSVTGKNRVPIAGLTAADFTLEVNGRAAPLASAEAASDPVQAAVVFNFYPPAGIAEFAAALVQANRASVVAVTKLESTRDAYTASPVALPPFSSDLQSLAAQLKHQQAVAATMHPSGWGSAPLARLRDAELSLRSAHATRSVIVEFLDEDIEAPGSGIGLPDDSSIASATAAMRAFNNAMRGTDAPIWTIVKPSAMYRGPASSSQSTERPEPPEQAFRFLSDASNSSGGAVLLSGGSAAEQIASFQKAASLIMSEYKLTFAAPAGAKLHVKVRRDGAHISAPDKLPVWP